MREVHIRQIREVEVREVIIRNAKIRKVDVGDSKFREHFCDVRPLRPRCRRLPLSPPPPPPPTGSRLQGDSGDGDAGGDDRERQQREEDARVAEDEVVDLLEDVVEEVVGLLGVPLLDDEQRPRPLPLGHDRRRAPLLAVAALETRPKQLAD